MSDPSRVTASPADVIPEYGLVVGMTADEAARSIMARYYPEWLDRVDTSVDDGPLVVHWGLTDEDIRVANDLLRRMPPPAPVTVAGDESDDEGDWGWDDEAVIDLDAVRVESA